MKMEGRVANRAKPCHRQADAATVPAELGFRMPAEWEPHEATWLAWPHNRTDWPGKFATIPWVCAEIVRKTTPGEIVRMLVNSAPQEKQARRVLASAGVDLARVRFLRIPTNRNWMRDSGPIFLRRSLSDASSSPAGGPRAHGRNARGELAIAGFRFNAWAKYDDWQADVRVSERAARLCGIGRFPVHVNGKPIVLEGGSIDVNGRGTLLTTEECLLDTKTQTRNASLNRKGIQKVLCDWLGVTNILWLGRGIAGDDTHGHVDDLCRFVGPRTVVCCREKNPRDVNYKPLAENLERLSGMRTEDGRRIEVVPLPMPAPLYYDGMRLPASYANFYFTNAAVLVPTFNDPNDRIALGILGELINDRPVVGIHAVDYVLGFGTIHCATQQEPKA